MAIKDFLHAAENKMEKAAKKRQFAKANREREDQIDLMAAQAMCRGKLEVCQRDFERTIRKQSQAIREGEAIDADTSIQEQILFDAAVGYVLVREAIFSLRSINSHHSISHAYGIMDLATKQMSGKKSGLPLKSIRNRNIYGYVTSEAAYQLKCDLVSSFYDELRQTGDIEACLSHAPRPGTREAEMRDSYTRDPNLPDRDPDPVYDSRAALSAQDTENVDFTFRGNPMSKGIDYSNGE